MQRSKSHKPTKALKDTVVMHTMVGTRQEVIADIIGIDPKTLRKHYRKELDQSAAQANATIGGALFNKAKSGDTAAAIFWLKTKAGFRETQHIDHTTNGEPITKIERVVIDSANNSNA